MSSIPLPINNTVKPQGGILIGSTIILAAFIGSNLYVVTSGTTTNSIVLTQALSIPSSGAPTLLVSPSSVLQFVVGTIGDSITLNLSGTSSYLGYDTTGLIDISTTTSSLFFNQSTYTKLLDPPNVLLSGIVYNVSGVSPAFVIEQLVINVSGGTTSIPADLIPLPFVYYATGSCTTPNSDLLTELSYLYCSYNTYSYCATLNGSAWTSQRLCNINNTFQYCTSGTTCTGNCYSACNNPESHCVFNNGGTYSCQPRNEVTSTSSPNVTPITTPAVPISSTSWFLILIILIILIVIGVIIYAYYESYYHMDTNDSMTVIHTKSDGDFNIPTRPNSSVVLL